MPCQCYACNPNPGYFAHPAMYQQQQPVIDPIKFHREQLKLHEKWEKKRADEEKAKKEKEKKPEKWWSKKFTLFETFAVCLVLSIPLAIVEHGLIKVAYRVLTSQ